MSLLFVVLSLILSDLGQYLEKYLNRDIPKITVSKVETVREGIGTSYLYSLIYYGLFFFLIVVLFSMMANLMHFLLVPTTSDTYPSMTDHLHHVDFDQDSTICDSLDHGHIPTEICTQTNSDDFHKSYAQCTLRWTRSGAIYGIHI